LKKAGGFLLPVRQGYGITRRSRSRNEISMRFLYVKWLKTTVKNNCEGMKKDVDTCETL